MPTATKNPTSDNSVSGTWTGSAGTRYTVVDDHPDSGGTDELTHGTTAGYLTFNSAPMFSTAEIPTGSTINSVKVYYYDYKNGSQSCQFGARLQVGGNSYNASTHNPGNGSANRTLRTDTWANNPKTTSSWTVPQLTEVDDVNALQGFGYYSSDANPTITTSSILLEVDYTLPAVVKNLAALGVG